MTRVGILGAPRPVPRTWVGPLAGALVIALAFPLFLLAGWELKGWAIAVVLWVGVQAFGLLLARVKPAPDRKSTRLNSSHVSESRMPSSA